MKFVSDNDAAARVSPRKYRCVWMEAGILSYLLCDREFDCERCPLDEAMRSHYSPVAGRHSSTEEEENTSPQDGDGAGTGRRDPAWTGTTDDHVSVTLLENGLLRVAVEETAAAVLPTVKSVVLPVPGRIIRAGSPCCWFIFDGGTLPIRMPFSATVEGVNDQLADHPNQALEYPGGTGWLFDLRPTDRAGALRVLLTPEETEACNFRDREIFHRLIGECVRPPGAIGGPTMQDGGHPLEDLPAVIGPVKYLEIVRRAFWGKR